MVIDGEIEMELVTMFTDRYAGVERSATDADIQSLKRAVHERFGVEAPADLYLLLKVCHACSLGAIEIFATWSRRAVETVAGGTASVNTILEESGVWWDQDVNLCNSLALSRSSGGIFRGWDFERNLWFVGGEEGDLYGSYENIDELLVDLLMEGGVDRRDLVPESILFFSYGKDDQPIFGTMATPK